LRNKLYDGLGPYVREADRDAISSKLSALEDWLYEDGEDETKSVYVQKLQVRGLGLGGCWGVGGRGVLVSALCCESDFGA